MEDINGYAEQCKDSSEEFPACHNRHVAQAAACDRHATADLHPPAHSWLIDYAVHTLWQTPLSLCNGARAWPQVLSVGEPSRSTPDTDLRPPHHGGAGARAVGPTTEGSHALRGAVQYWLRIAHAPCRQITRSDVVGQLACGGGCDRYHGRQSTRGQHVRTRSEIWLLARATTRGGAPCSRR